MKALKLTVLALSLTGASIALAGPGPQFWVRPAAPKSAGTTSNRATVATTTATPVKTASAQPANCSCCTDASTCSMHR